MLRNVTLAFALLTAFAAPLAAQAPAPDATRRATLSRRRHAPRAKTDGRHLGILQRRPREDLHHHVPATIRPRSARGSNSIRPAPASFRSFGEIAGWSQAENDFLRLLDAKGQSVLEFSEVESGIFEAPRPGEGILFIQNASALGPAPRTAEQMTGDWTIVRRAGKPICALTLSNTAAGEEFVGSRAAAVRRRSSRALRRRPGRWTAANWCCDRRAASPGASRRASDSKWQRLPADRRSACCMVRK